MPSRLVVVMPARTQKSGTARSVARRLVLGSLTASVLTAAAVGGPVLGPNGVPLLGSSVASADPEPGNVPAQPVETVPAQPDPAAAVDPLPLQTGDIPTQQSQSVEVDDKEWTPVPGVPLEVRPHDAETLTQPDETASPSQAPSPQPSGEPSLPSDSSPASGAAYLGTVSLRAAASGEQPSDTASPSDNPTSNAPSDAPSVDPSGSASQSPSVDPSTGALEEPAAPATVEIEVGRPVDSRQRFLLFSFTDTTTEASTDRDGTSAATESGVAAPATYTSHSMPTVSSPEEEETATDTEPVDAAESLEVRLSYEDFALAYGGVWGERMQVFAYPACFAATPELPQCAVGVPVEFNNDLDDQTLTFATMDQASLETALAAAEVPDTDSADLENSDTDGSDIEQGGDAGTDEPSASASPSTTPDGAADSSSDSAANGAGATAGSVSTAVFRSTQTSSNATISDTATVADASSGGVVYSVGGSGGNYAATPLSPSMDWQVGVGSGDFTYDYDFTLPKANAGATPGLGLNYSSGQVDAMSLAENGQADPAGIGWTMATSYVARKYGSCSDDGWSAKGDLCWNKRNGALVDDFTIVLNGKSSTLVRIDNTKQFRLRQDPTWQVELQTGATNGDEDNGEHFVVTDTDGTKYFFGTNVASTQVVPVFGDDTGEPCYTSDATAAGQRWCKQPYQWNLQRVVDIHGNKIVYTYDEETNYYARWGNTTSTEVYDSSATLSKIEYGFNSAGTVAHQVVNVVTGKRCTTELNGGTCGSTDGPVAKPNLWPDVPSDLICNSGQTCLVGSPTFFSTKRYARVETKTVDGNAATATTRPVDTYTLTHTMPDPDGTGPDQADLWLSQVTRTGQSGAGTLDQKPVRFFGTELRNRVVATGSERTLRKFRITGIRNETGGKIDVVYGHATPDRVCDAAYVTGRDRWNSTRECFAQKYAPPGATAKWEWFHKYVVTRVALGDEALGYQLGAGSNTDLGTLAVYDYEYTGAPAWRFLDSRHAPTADETWNDWRGYAESRTRLREANATNSGISGGADVTVTRTVQFRGMNQSLPAPGLPLINNTRINTNEISADSTEQFDEAWLAGMVAESETRTSDDKLISRTYHQYGDAVTAKDPYGVNARVVYEQMTRVRTPISGTGHFITETTRKIDTGSNTANNNFGVGVGTETESETITKTEGAGAADYKTCTRTQWTTNPTDRVRRPSQVTTYGENCANTATGNMVSRVDNFYDNYQGTSTPNAVGKGNLTSTRTYLNAAGSSYEGTKTTYDTYGRPLTVTTGVTQNNAGGSTTTTDYNPQGGPELDDDLVTKVATTGPTGYTTTTTLDPRRGLPTQVVDLNGNPTALAYDPLGRLTDVQMPNHAGSTQSIQFSYTDNMAAPGRVKTQVRFDDKPDGTAAFEESYTFYDGWGRPIETQVPHPAATEPRKRIVSVTGYDEQGRVYAAAPAESNEVAGTGSPFVAVLNPKLEDLYSWTKTTYDAAGRVTRTQDLTRENGVSVGVRSTDTTYTGDTITVTPPGAAGKTLTKLDAGGQPSEIQYRNAADTTWIDKATYAYTQLGQLSKVTKKLGNLDSNWTWTFDWLGRTTQAVDPDTGTTNTTYTSTSGAEPTQVKVENPDGITTTYYDKLGRPVRRETGQPNATAETVATWSYDPATANGKGQLNQVTAIAPTGSADAGKKFVTTYNSFNKLGKPTTITQSYPATWTGESPTPGSVSGVTNMVDRPITYTYDQAGDLKTATYPAVTNGATTLLPPTKVSYLKAPETGATQSITAELNGTSTQTAVLANYGYTNIGQIKTLTSAATAPAGSTTAATFRRSYTYDTALGRTDSITAAVDPDGAGATAADTRLTLGYTYDRNDNPTQILRTAKTTQNSNTTTIYGRSCFTYDDLNRLSTAVDQVRTTGSATCADQPATDLKTVYDYAYTYETQGDRLTAVTSKAAGSAQTVNYAYNVVGAPHRLSSMSNSATSPDALLPVPAVQTWNDAGRVTTATPTTGTGVITYSYDTQGRVTNTARNGGPVVENVYDTDGIRLARRTTNGAGAKRTLYLRGGLEITATETAGAASLTAARLEHASREGLQLASQDGSSFTWLASDSQGSTRLTADAGTVKAYDYTPYGDPVDYTTSLTTLSSMSTPGERGYLNKTHDAGGELRLDQRTFNPRTSTFTTPDPVLVATDPLSFNPYTYARHNPITLTDPSGMCPPEVCGTPSMGGGGYGQDEKTLPYNTNAPLPSTTETSPSGEGSGCSGVCALGEIKLTCVPSCGGGSAMPGGYFMPGMTPAMLAGGVTAAATSSAIGTWLLGGGSLSDLAKQLMTAIEDAQNGSDSEAAADKQSPPTTEDLADLVPEGEKNLNSWGAKIWGRGPEGARKLMGSRSGDELREIPGLNIDSARTLRDFYQNAANLGKGGPAAPLRVALMTEIIRRLSE